MHGSSWGGGSMTTLSKDDNLPLSSEDSSSPDHDSHHLELGLGLTLSPSPLAKSHPSSSSSSTLPYVRILTAKDFPSSVSSSSSSSSLDRSSVTSGTKRAADSVVAANGPR